MRLRLHGSRDIREDRHLSSGPRVMMERASDPHHDRHEDVNVGHWSDDAALLLPVYGALAAGTGGIL